MSPTIFNEMSRIATLIGSRINHLFNHLFKHPYSKIKYLKDELGVSRQTATKYLDVLTETGYLEKEKQGRDNYYLNRELLTVIQGDR